MTWFSLARNYRALWETHESRFGNSTGRFSGPRRFRVFWETHARSYSGSPRFTDFPLLCACSESSLTNLIGSGLNLLCLKSHSKPECRWTWPEVKARGRDFQCWPKGSRSLGTRMLRAKVDDVGERDLPASWKQEDVRLVFKVFFSILRVFCQIM